MIRVGSVVIRVDDLQRQAEFWEAALGYVRRCGDSDDFVLLMPEHGNGPNLALDRVASSLQIPPRIHIDLYADDQRAEVERLLEWGLQRSPGTRSRQTPTRSFSPTRKATDSASWTRADSPTHTGRKPQHFRLEQRRPPVRRICQTCLLCWAYGKGSRL